MEQAPEMAMSGTTASPLEMCPSCQTPRTSFADQGRNANYPVYNPHAFFCTVILAKLRAAGYPHRLMKEGNPRSWSVISNSQSWSSDRPAISAGEQVSGQRNQRSQHLPKPVHKEQDLRFGIPQSQSPAGSAQLTSSSQGDSGPWYLWLLDLL